MINLDFRLLRQFWYFLVLAEERNFGRAAHRLHISQPPLTQQIQALEHALGMRLFDRSHRQTTLTAAGAAILPAVQRLVDQAARLERIAEEARRGLTGVVTIGAITAAIISKLPDVIARAKEGLPGATVVLQEMSSGDAWNALQAGDIDIAFGRFSAPSGDIRVEILETDDLHVALPPSHSLGESEVVELLHLRDEPMIQFPRRASPPYFDQLIAACQAAGFSPRLSHEVDSVLSQVAFVASGFGVALVPRSVTSTVVTPAVIRPLYPVVKVTTVAAAWRQETPLIREILGFAGLQALGRVRASPDTP